MNRQLLPRTGTSYTHECSVSLELGSQLVTILADLIDHQTDPTLAPYAKTVTLRLSTKSSQSKKRLIKLSGHLENQSWIARLLKEFLYETSVTDMGKTSLTGMSL